MISLEPYGHYIGSQLINFFRGTSSDIIENGGTGFLPKFRKNGEKREESWIELFTAKLNLWRCSIHKRWSSWRNDFIIVLIVPLTRSAGFAWVAYGGIKECSIPYFFKRSSIYLFANSVPLSVWTTAGQP